jgi:hypothetical protein
MRLGNKLGIPLLQGKVAEIEANVDHPEEALVRIDQALALAKETGEHSDLALLHRIRGEILFKLDSVATTPAEESFLSAVAIAHHQGARTYRLHAALALAKIYQATGRGAGRARASTRGLRSDTGPSGDCRSGSAPNCDRADRTTSSATGAHVSLLRERSKCRLNWSGGAAPCRAEFNFSTFHRSRRGRKQLGVGRQIAPFAIALAVHNQSGLY